MSEIISISQNNSIRFVLLEPTALVLPGNYDYILDAEEQRQGVTHAPYRQPVLTTEEYPVQFRSNYTTHEARIIDAAGSTVKTIAPVIARVLSDSRVYEVSFDFSTLAQGIYHCEISGTAAGQTDFLLKSEPLEIVANADGTVLIEWFNFEDIERIYYSTSIVFKMRVKGMIRRISAGLSMDVYTASNNDLTINEGSVVRMITLNTFSWPDWLHELVALMSIQDALSINSVAYKRMGESGFDPAEKYSLTQSAYTFRQQGFDFQNLSVSNERVLAPDAVVDLAAEYIIGENRIVTTWTPAADEAYEVYGSNDGGVVYALLDTTALNIGTYNHTSLTDGDIWDYYVVVLKGGLSSASSNVASAEVVVFNPIYASNPANNNAIIA